MTKEELKKVTEQARQEIVAYLADTMGTYEEGFAILQKYSIKISMMHMMARKGATPLMVEKLRYELEKLSKQESIPVSPYADKAVLATMHPALHKALGKTLGEADKRLPAEKIIVEAMSDKQKEEGTKELNTIVAAITKDKKIDFDALPEDMAKHYAKARHYYHVFHHWHTMMKQATTDKDRAHALKMVKEYEDLKAEAWGAIDQWIADGAKVNEPTPEPAAEKPAELKRAIGAAESYLSRYTKGLATKEGKKYEHLKEMVTAKVKLLQDNEVEIPKPALPLLKEHGILG